MVLIFTAHTAAINKSNVAENMGRKYNVPTDDSMYNYWE